MTEDIIKEIKKHIEKIEDYKSNFPPLSFNKLSGNIVAMILRKYIKRILSNHKELNYTVAPCNSFIDGYPTEWDLIILKNPAKGIDDINIYDPKDCICALEIKKSGMVGNKESFKNILNNQIDNINKIKNTVNKKINFGYISFQETPAYYKETKEMFKDAKISSNNVFAFVTYPYTSKSSTKICNDFEEYILNILK